MTPAEHMRNSADVQESRDAEYGSAYKRHGPAIASLFPNGVTLQTDHDHTRFAILTLLFGKLTRYCGSFERGGHEDSLTDLIAYTAMLKECDEDARYVPPDCDDPTSLMARVTTHEFATARHPYDPRLEK